MGFGMTVASADSLAGVMLLHPQIIQFESVSRAVKEEEGIVREALLNKRTSPWAGFTTYATTHLAWTSR